MRLFCLLQFICHISAYKAVCIAACIAACIGCIAPCYAQLPARVAVELQLGTASQQLEGKHHLLVRWYDDALSSNWVESEEFDVDLTQAPVQLQLGSTSPVPHDLLRTGTAWLGVSIDGGTELPQRTMLVTVPYAQYTEHARVADKLSEDVTDVVTSLNEIAGAVKVLGQGGIVVRNEGEALVITTDQPIESGVVHGDDTEHAFVVKPTTQISSSCRVTATVVSPTTIITCGIASIDASANTITIQTSAALTKAETLHWFLMHR